MPGLDWDLVVERAQTHRVLPLLHRSLALVRDGVPQPIFERIRRTTLLVAIANLIRNEELTRLARAFHQAGIEIIPMKGPSLAERVYGDVALRIFSDLDILIRPEAVPAAKGLLVELGYQPEPMAPGQEQLHLRVECEYAFSRQDGNLPLFIEIHWAVMPGIFGNLLDAVGVWKRSVAGSEPGTRRMSCEDELLYLCIHGWKHCWDSLQWLCDIHEFQGRYRDEIDWKQFLERARTQKVQRIVGTALWLVAQLFGSELHTAVEDVMKRDWRWRRLQVEPDDSFPGIGRPRTNVETLRFYLRSLPSVGRRAAYLAKLLVQPTGTDFQEVTLPATAAWAYPVLRPMRIAWKTLSGRQSL
jgi:hypothetical protein